MAGLPWETMDSEVGYSCDGFDIVSQEVRLPDGETTDFDYLSEAESVVILPFTPYGKVVVIDEWRQAVQRLNRGLPAGSVEEGEGPDDAAQRELREETGYEAGKLTHMTTMEPANGFSDAVFHYYVARECEEGGEQDLDHDESISVDTVTLDGLVESTRDGEIRDGRTAFAVIYYSLFEISSGLPSW
jgi:ADP-ribose pyrophosphatase